MSRFENDNEDRPGDYDEQDAALASYYSNATRHDRQESAEERMCPYCRGTGLDLSYDSGGSCPHCIGGRRFD